MKTISTHKTTLNYVAELDRGDIRINPDYQRSDDVWPVAARSFLIETILLDFPVPKLCLHQVTDAATKQSYQELVDGQQRTAAIRDFLKGTFRLTGSVDNAALKGKKFADLEVEQQGTFQNFQLDFDLFIGADAAQIRQVFRRMNSFTVPLNPEEQRHAVHQGPFKWFIHGLGLHLGDAFETLDTFRGKALVRMGDAKLLAEITDAMVRGITTTNKKALDDIYEKFNEKFASESDFTQRLTVAFDDLLAMQAIHRTPVCTAHQLYSLVLALIHTRKRLGDHFPANLPKRVPLPQMEANLLRLASALDDPERAPKKFTSFLLASAGGTNVKAKRVARFDWYCRAVTSQTL